MFTTLAPGAIGIKGLSLAESIDLAARSGFQGVTFDVREVATLAEAHGVDYVKKLFSDAGVLPAYWGLPVSWGNDEKRDADLKDLPRFTALALELGNDRATSGIMPGNDERPFDEQYAWTKERLLPVAESLKASGARLGIEFIAPKTLRNRFKYEFIYSLNGMMDLARDLGTGNVGVLLDLWHNYTSYGTNDDILALNERDIIAVHVNDAPPGIPVDEQQDLVRALPLETGVLDAKGFMDALKTLGYAGPVMPEPFSQRINDLAATDPLAAAKETAESMKKLWALAGLS
jgi:sugar phosphate isomerase/epimerase